MFESHAGTLADRNRDAAWFAAHLRDVTIYLETGRIFGGEFADGKSHPCMCDCCDGEDCCAEARPAGVYAHILFDNPDADLAALPVTVSHHPATTKAPDVVFTEVHVEASTAAAMAEADCRISDRRCITHDAYTVTAGQCSHIRKIARAALSGAAWNIRDTRVAGAERRTLSRLDNVTL